MVEFAVAANAVQILYSGGTREFLTVVFVGSIKNRIGQRRPDNPAAEISLMDIGNQFLKCVKALLAEIVVVSRPCFVSRLATNVDGDDRLAFGSNRRCLQWWLGRTGSVLRESRRPRWVTDPGLSAAG